MSDITAATIRPGVVPVAAPLGRNEFSGQCLVYRISSDDGEIFSPGSLAGCNGREIPLFWDHQTPVGRGTLHETPRGVEIRGWITPFMDLGKRVLELLHSGFTMELCLSCRVIRGRPALGPQGQNLSIIQEATPIECSIVLIAGLPDCRITALGPIDVESFTDEDRAFVQPEAMFRQMAENSALYARKCALRASKAAPAVPSLTFSGSTVRTAASGARVELDSSNGLRGINSSGQTLVQITTAGAFTLKSATSGARIEISNTDGIKVYDSSGSLIFAVFNGVYNAWTQVDRLVRPGGDGSSASIQVNDLSMYHAVGVTTVWHWDEDGIHLATGKTISGLQRSVRPSQAAGLRWIGIHDAPTIRPVLPPLQLNSNMVSSTAIAAP